MILEEVVAGSPSWLVCACAELANQQMTFVERCVLALHVHTHSRNARINYTCTL